MDWDHFGRIPQSVRREPIRLNERRGWDIITAGLVLMMLVVAVVSAVLIFFARPAYPREGPQWAQMSDPETRAWYGRQRMPDSPARSCCGEGDAYYADDVLVVHRPDGTIDVFAVITDERPDAPLGRPHIKPGTKVFVPPHKNKDTRSDPNPTGHTVVFVRWYDNDDGGDFAVLCFLPNGTG